MSVSFFLWNDWDHGQNYLTFCMKIECITKKIISISINEKTKLPIEIIVENLTQLKWEKYTHYSCFVKNTYSDLFGGKDVKCRYVAYNWFKTFLQNLNLKIFNYLIIFRIFFSHIKLK